MNLYAFPTKRDFPILETNMESEYKQASDRNNKINYWRLEIGFEGITLFDSVLFQILCGIDPSTGSRTEIHLDMFKDLSV